MTKLLPEDRLLAVVAVLRNAPNGASFIEVAASLNPLPPKRNVQRWLTHLVAQKQVLRVGSGRAARYRLPDPVAPDVPIGDNSVAQAVRRLVSLPLAVRMAVRHQRRFLDLYRPNETPYLPAEFRARMLDLLGKAAWREKPAFDRMLTALVSRALALEDAFDSSALRNPAASCGWRDAWPERARGELVDSVERHTPRHERVRPPRTLTDADIVACLAEPEARGVRPDVQLVWNIRGVLVDLVNRNPKPPLSSQLVSEVYDRLTAKLAGVSGSRRAVASDLTPPGARAVASLACLRASPVVLSDTVYCPPGDAVVIQTCFEQLLRVALAITDPLEQAFFLLTHLLYLQPFAALNATMALVLMNVPLMARGLSPIVFSAVPPADLLAGIRGVWELNRVELLADAFAARPSA